MDEAISSYQVVTQCCLAMVDMSQDADVPDARLQRCSGECLEMSSLSSSSRGRRCGVRGFSSQVASGLRGVSLGTHCVLLEVAQLIDGDLHDGCLLVDSSQQANYNCCPTGLRARARMLSCATTTEYHLKKRKKKKLNHFRGIECSSCSSDFETKTLLGTRSLAEPGLACEYPASFS